MRRTNCILYVLFQIALIVSMVTMNTIIKGVTMIVFFPFMLLMSMWTVTTSNGTEYRDELAISYDTIALSLEAIIWDTAIKNGGIWITLFLISVVLMLGRSFLILRRPS